MLHVIKARNSSLQSAKQTDTRLFSLLILKSLESSVQKTKGESYEKKKSSHRDCVRKRHSMDADRGTKAATETGSLANKTDRRS